MNRRSLVFFLLAGLMFFLPVGCAPRGEKQDPSGAKNGTPRETATNSLEVRVIDDLLFALENSDMVVEEHQLKDYEKKRLQRLEETIRQNRELDRPDSLNPVEVAIRKVDGIEVNFFRYRDSYRPREIYEELQNRRITAEKEGDREARLRYDTVEIINGPFLLMIYRWEPVTDSQGKTIGRKPINPDQETIDKIQRVVEQFNTTPQ